MSKHVNVDLLKTTNTHGSILIKLVKPLLIEFQLMDKVIAYVINKGCDITNKIVFNWNMCTFVA
jgi:hypothetical protein